MKQILNLLLSFAPWIAFLVLAGRPFTEDYVKKEVSKELWETGSFVRGCYASTSVWAFVFLLNLGAAFLELFNRDIPKSNFAVFNYSVLLAGVIYTNLFSKYQRRKRERLAKSSALEH